MTPAPAICGGATGATVGWAQYLLAGLALSCNRIDGIVGPVTKTAAGHFRRGSHRTVGRVPGRRMSRRLAGSCPLTRSAAAVRPRRHRAAPAPDHQEEPR